MLHLCFLKLAFLKQNQCSCVRSIWDSLGRFHSLSCIRNIFPFCQHWGATAWKNCSIFSVQTWWSSTCWSHLLQDPCCYTPDFDTKRYKTLDSKRKSKEKDLAFYYYYYKPTYNHVEPIYFIWIIIFYLFVNTYQL